MRFILVSSALTKAGGDLQRSQNFLRYMPLNRPLFFMKLDITIKKLLCFPSFMKDTFPLYLSNLPILHAMIVF